MDSTYGAAVSTNGHERRCWDESVKDRWSCSVLSSPVAIGGHRNRRVGRWPRPSDTTAVGFGQGEPSSSGWRAGSWIDHYVQRNRDYLSKYHSDNHSDDHNHHHSDRAGHAVQLKPKRCAALTAAPTSTQAVSTSTTTSTTIRQSRLAPSVRPMVTLSSTGALHLPRGQRL